MIRCAIAVLALAGCDQAFGLERPPSDAAFDADPSCHPVGHDDDHDCVPDAIDSCPGVANDQSEDRDGDGIGDACDPNVTMTGDRLVEFVSFAEADVQTRWIPSDAAWTFGADHDSLRFDRPVFGTYGVMRDSPGHETPPFTAIARVVLETIPAARAQLGLVGGVTGLNTGIACSVIRGADGVDFTQVYQAQANKDDEPTPALRDGDVLELRYTYDPVDRTAICETRLQSGTGGGARSKITLTTTPAAGPFAFEANGETARIENVAFYTR